MFIIINYCTYDQRYINKVIEQAYNISKNIIAVYSDHFFDGVVENFELINETKKTWLPFSSVKFVEIQWTPGFPSRYWHNMFRRVGFQYTNSEYVMFLNSDEILESELVNKYLTTEHYKKYDAISFACYWYFREPYYRATQLENIGFIINSKICNDTYLMHSEETFGYRYLNVKYQDGVTLDGQIMCHHYSWCRNKEEMMRKVLSWGHNKDRNWSAMVEEEFSRPFNGRDFIHGYNYLLVENKFNV